MHRLRTVATAIAMLWTAGSVSSCTTDRALSPVAPMVNGETANAARRATIARDIAVLEAVLADSGASRIGRGRTELARMHTKLRKQLIAAGDPGYTDDDPANGPGQAAPPCYLLTGNLDGCFLYAQHHTAIDGTGWLTQVTAVIGSQSAVVTILLDGQPIQKPLGATGFSGSSNTFSQNYAYARPDCNRAAHTVSSTAMHLVSAALAAGGGQSVNAGGAKPSDSPPERCEQKGLTVDISPSSMLVNEQADVVVGNIRECTAVGLTASPGGIVDIFEGGNNHWLLTGIGRGTATISAQCGTQRGSGTITVSGDQRCDNELVDLQEDGSYAGPGEGGRDCNSPTPGSGGGGYTHCTEWIMEISYDGGASWTEIARWWECS